MSRKVSPAGLRRTLLAASVAACFSVSSNQVLANPTGGTVVSGSASFATAGSTLTVTNSANTIINWQGFSIGINEITRFLQSSASSAVLNRVIGANGAIPQSVIDGVLQSNGRVFLLNPMGIVIGPSARIDVAGLVASSLNLSNDDFLAGRMRFTEVPGAGGIVNSGSIATPAGGHVYLVAPSVENNGIITAPQGEIILAAGKSAELVSENSPYVTVKITADSEQALNVGSLIADSGRIGMYGALVRNSGVAEASSAVAGPGGQIRFVATKDLTLDAGSRTAANGASGGDVLLQAQGGTNLISGTVEAKGASGLGGSVEALGLRVGVIGNGVIDASGQTGGGTVLVGGDAHGVNPDVQNAQQTLIGSDGVIRADAATSGDGGRVIVWSDEYTRFFGSISARGGSQSGNGGFVETSGHTLDAFGSVNIGAPNGTGGTWLLDPYDLQIVSGTSSFSPCSPTTICFTDGSPTGPSQISVADINGALAYGSGGNTVTAQAQHDIALTTDLALTSPGGTLIAKAGNDIALGAYNISTNGTSLQAYANDNSYGTMTGTGSITSSLGGGNITTNGGSIYASGAAITVGNINTSGGSPSDSSVTLNSTSGAISTGSITTGSGWSSFVSLEAASGITVNGSITTGSADASEGTADSSISLYAYSGDVHVTGSLLTGNSYSSCCGDAYSNIYVDASGDIKIDGVISTGSAISDDTSSYPYSTVELYSGGGVFTGSITTGPAVAASGWGYSYVDVSSGGPISTGPITTGSASYDSVVRLSSSDSVSTGSIKTGATGDGGEGFVYIDGAANVTVSGAIQTGNTGVGGYETSVDISSLGGSISTGSITTGSGSWYSQVDLYASSGNISTGAITTGDASTGYGSDVYLSAYYGAISTGPITTGASGSSSSVNVYSTGDVSTGAISTGLSNYSSVWVSSTSGNVATGNILSEGGEGAVRINAYGNIVAGSIQTASYASSLGAEVYLSSANGNIAVGNIATGSALYSTYIDLYAPYGSVTSGALTTSTPSNSYAYGSAANYVNIQANGDINSGPLTTRSQVPLIDGGYVSLMSASGAVSVGGGVDTRGADAVAGSGAIGGNGGAVSLSAATDLKVKGSIITRGGMGDAANGGAGGSVTLLAANNVTVGLPATVGVYNTVIDTSGGDGGVGGAGGNAGDILVDPTAILFNGSVYAMGGAGSGAPGGNGGNLQMMTTNGSGTITFINGGYDVTGGLGSPPGIDGTVTADGTLIFITLLNQDPFSNPAVAQSISSAINDLLIAKGDGTKSQQEEEEDRRKKGAGSSCKP